MSACLSICSPVSSSVYLSGLGSLLFYSVPMVTILLGANDRGPLENVDRTLDKELPVVIMKGTGGVADLLIFALKELIKRSLRIAYFS